MYLTPPAIDIRWGRFSLQTLPPSTRVFLEERMCGEPSLSGTCSSLKTKGLKLLHHLERSRGRPEDFSDFVDQCRMSVSHESRALTNVHDSSCFESHQPRAYRVGSHRIVCKHDLPHRPRRAVERSIAFHRHDPVRDNE